MKKTIVAALLAFIMITPGLAFAGTADNCGCGVGTMIFQDKDGLFSQLFATLTNGTFGNQTFGITSGTLGCEKPSTFAKNEKVDRFVSENMDNLAVDIAAGQGETLSGLAELIDVPAEKRSGLFVSLQNNFDKIYPTDDVTHIDVVKEIGKIVESI